MVCITLQRYVDSLSLKERSLPSGRRSRNSSLLCISMTRLWAGRASVGIPSKQSKDRLFLFFIQFPCRPVVHVSFHIQRAEGVRSLQPCFWSELHRLERMTIFYCRSHKLDFGSSFLTILAQLAQFVKVTAA